MPFHDNSATDRKLQFIHECLAGELALTTLCQKYGISRPTGDKWIKRYKEEGASGLDERSHAVKNHTNALEPRIEELILRARGKHPSWGPKKLIAWIQEREGLEHVCATSTAHELLRIHGMLRPRKLHRSSAVSSQPLGGYEGANAVWCIDFKGWFRMGNGKRCDPLTITDGYSRYLLRCQALERTGLENVRRICEAAFREYGMPQRIRSDNGAPFASVAIGGLSALAVMWIKLGITPERIAPGRPDQNGRHERMHLTLNEAIQPPSYDLRAQQRRFERFQRCFNEERPHEALEQKTPASAYLASPRPYPGSAPDPEYDTGTLTRKVQKKGEFKWGGEEIFLSETLRGEHIGLDAIGDGVWTIRFCTMVLGTFDERTLQIVPKDAPRKRRRASPEKKS